MIYTTVVLLCCFTICLAAAGSKITGDWTGTVKTPDGNEMPVTYSLKADSDTMTGSVRAPQGSVSIKDGKITGDDFSFGVAVNDIRIEHTGKYYSVGDTVSLDIDFNGQLFHTTLKRANK